MHLPAAFRRSLSVACTLLSAVGLAQPGTPTFPNIHPSWPPVGSHPRQVTRSAYDNAWPQWSRDGSEIVFASRRDGDWEIYSMRADGTAPRRLTVSPGRDAHPIFLPSGRIVFQSPRGFDGPGEVELYTMDANGDRVRPLVTAPGFDGVPVPSPNGSQLAFQRGVSRGNGLHWELWLVDSLGRNARQLTRNNWSSQVATWSPDGRHLAFFANPDGRDQLFRIELATSAVTALHRSSGEDRAPSWSPDGREIAFTTTRFGGNDLVILDLATGELQRVTAGLEVMAQPGWSRDGQTLLFSAVHQGVHEVFRVHRNGSGLTRLTTGFEGTR
ncbi:MAG: PD40 domain-containing protein [Gemmatimonadetes bacterium]|nr:PD40 domain-containing protein [Gemmatimonadota bacterium]